jgi:ribonuclease PH
MTRLDGRSADQLRPLSFIPDIAPHATGSLLIAMGNTKVICSATIEEGVPRWMKDQKVEGGWITAEYAMLPYSTLQRNARDSTRGKLDGRGVEIQRLIGRSLRAVIDLDALGPRTLWIDCDVLQADGGTRTAAITGACVAASMACRRLLDAKTIARMPIKHLVAAVSVGICADVPLLDLNYLEDKDATVDMNLVMTDDGNFVEVQGAGEESTFSHAQLNDLLALGRSGIGQLFHAQQAALASATAS